MIKKIQVYNFKSFIGFTEIDFTKTHYKHFEETHTRNDIIKSAIIAGGNATGKTNILLALRFLAEVVVGNYDIDSRVFRNNKCKFTSESYFYIKYFFEIDGKEVVYFIQFDISNNAIEEKLDIDNKTVFNRCKEEYTLYNAEIYTNLYDSGIIGGDIKNTDIFMENISLGGNIPYNVLFFKNHYYNTKFNNSETIIKFYDEIANIMYIDQDSKYMVLSNNEANPINKTKFEIDDFTVNHINEFLEKINYNFRIEVVRDELNDRWIPFFKRNGFEQPLSFDIESKGNRTLINLILPFIHAIQDNAILIIDEFSNSFHNELEELFIDYFIKNSDEAQLIVTTHSSNVLSNKLLRPDQMYAVGFDNEKGTTIKRFSDEQPRLSQNTEKMYLSGSFGGVPRYGRD